MITLKSKGTACVQSVQATWIIFLLLGLSACASVPVSLAPPHAPLVAGRTVPVVPYPDVRALLKNRDPQLAANKQLVFDMWRTVRDAGHTEVAGHYLSADYQEHSSILSTGLAAFTANIAATVKRLEQVPAVITDPIVTIVAERDFVAVASVDHYLEPDDSGHTYTSTHFDLYRIANGRIAEHWDSSQIPKGFFPPSPAAGGPLPVTGIKGLPQIDLLQNADPLLANNKRLVFDIWRHTSEAGREEAALLYLDPTYIQHNPNAATGRAGFMDYFSKRPDTPIETTLKSPMIAIVAEGDLVVQVLQGERPDPNTPGKINQIAWFDMFRLQNGRAIEHWDTASKGELPKIFQQKK